MMELADVLDSKSSGSDTVRVRPPLPAPSKKGAPYGAPFLFGVKSGWEKLHRVCVFASGKVRAP